MDACGCGQLGVMIQKFSKLTVADNSGAKVAMCIGFVGIGSSKSASICDTIVVTVKASVPNGSIKNGEVSKAVVVRTQKEIKRKNGEYIRFGDNAVVLLNDDLSMKGTRLFGPVARELKKRGFQKITSLASDVV